MTSPLAIVTGGSSGIGLETSRRLIAEGWRVLIAGRNPEALESAARSLGPAASALAADVSRPEACDAIIGRARESGGLRALVNNAGHAPLRPIPESDDTLIAEAFAINAVGPAMLIARAWPMLVAGGGCIVNISSMASIDPFPGFFAYAAAKASVNLMARSCALEGARYGVRAFAVAPGAVETPMLRGLFPESSLPKARTLAPSDVASIIVACIRGDHDDVNGQVIPVPSP